MMAAKKVDIGPLIVQFEYSATANNEASVATGETVRFINKSADGWILIEKGSGRRGVIPEDWVLTEDGLTVTDVYDSAPAIPSAPTGQPLKKATSEEDAVQQTKARRERKTMLLLKLAQKTAEVEAKERAMVQLEEFLLSNQSAAASARMTVIEEDYENFHQEDVDVNLGAAEDDNEEENSPAHMNPGHQRAYVVAELIETEKEYGKDLQLIVEQFMEPMAQKPELFDARAVEFLFSNILEILQFQKEFVKRLDRSIGLKPSFKSEIGKPFEESANSFKLYTVYCGNHGRATDQIEELVQNKEAFKVLEACRLLAAARCAEGSTQQKSGIGLDGFLLTPIQRICKYPLLLKELLKATPSDHADYAPLTNALEVMKQVALSINEDKRNTEHLVLIQERISNWQGPVLVETSSILIHEGVLTKISGGKAQERYFYLLDNLLVYCKRNVSGRFVFRGRVPTDSLLIKNVEDGKVDGKSFANGMVLENQAKSRTYILYAKTPELKTEWMNKFAEERTKVAADNSAGIDRRCRERLNTTTGGTRQPRRGKNKSMKEMRTTLGKEIVEEVAREIEDSRKDSSGGRVAQFKAVDVKFSISKDSIWASKPAQLFARSTVSIIQEILDRFMLSHLNPEDFELVQHTKHGGFTLPIDPIPLFSMRKTVEEPFHFYLHHRQLSNDPKLFEVAKFDQVAGDADDV